MNRGLQVAMQMGGAVPYGARPGPNFFNLPPQGGPLYPSMDPSQAGTRAQRGGGGGNPEAGPSSKRQRGPDAGFMPGPGGYYGQPGGPEFPPSGGPMPPPWAGGFGGLRPPLGWRPAGPAPPAGAPLAAGGPAAPPEVDGR